MIKRSILALGVLSLVHSASFACSGTDCASDVDGAVRYSSYYNVDPNSVGIYLQQNTGLREATVTLKNIVMQANGNIDATALAIGNNASIELNLNSSAVPVRQIYQVNTGNTTSSVDLHSRIESATGQVELTSLAIGNNASITVDDIVGQDAKLSQLSSVQCNTGNGIADVVYRNDPTKLTATALAIGNNLSIGGKKSTK